jgi:hypothetical protein
MKSKDRIKKYDIVGDGIVCRKCNGLCEIRKRKIPPKNKNFFYKQWNFCVRCNAVYFNENDKSQDWQEDERQQDFFSSLRKQQ